jgi:hypothetical protein
MEEMDGEEKGKTKNKKKRDLCVYYQQHVMAIFDRSSSGSGGGRGRWLHGPGASEQQAYREGSEAALQHLYGHLVPPTDFSRSNCSSTEMEEEEEGEGGTASDIRRFVLITSLHTVIECDVVVCALGVVPNTSQCGVTGLQQDDMGAICVDEKMATSAKNVYAAGDCCNYQPSPSAKVASTDPNCPWFQMRLWAQARVMGVYAAQCINEGRNSLLVSNSIGKNSSGDDAAAASASASALDNKDDDYEVTRNDWAFQLFAHVTNFFGFKIVLLGRFNGQGLGAASEHVIRKVLVAEDSLKDSSDKAANNAVRSTNSSGTKRKSADSTTSTVLDFASSSKRIGRVRASTAGWGGCACCVDEPIGAPRQPSSAFESLVANSGSGSASSNILCRNSRGSNNDVNETIADTTTAAAADDGDGGVEGAALEVKEDSVVVSPGAVVNLTPAVEVVVRITPGEEYIKLVLLGGKVVGALLIGETDLEETFENIILNRIDVSHLGDQLLDPEHDLEDYFD